MCLQRRDTRETLKILGAYRVFSICVSRDAWISPALLFFAEIWDYSQSKTHTSFSASDSTPTCMWLLLYCQETPAFTWVQAEMTLAANQVYYIKSGSTWDNIIFYTTQSFLIMIVSSCYPEAFQGGAKALNQQLHTTRTWSRCVGPWNSHTKPMSRHFHKLIYV